MGSANKTAVDPSERSIVIWSGRAEAGGEAKPVPPEGARGRSGWRALRSVAGCPESLDNAARDATPGRELDLVGLGPLAHRLGRDVAGLGGGGRRNLTATAATDRAGCSHVAGQRRAQGVGVLVGEVQLVALAIQSEGQGLAVTANS